MAPKRKGPSFYAVQQGKVPGVYKSWPEAEAQVKGFQGAVHKKFGTLEEAQAYLSGKRGYEPEASATASGSDTGGPSQWLEERAVKRARTTHGRRGARSRSRSPGQASRSARKVYCDGSSLGNGQKGSAAGIGVFWGHEEGSPNLSERLPGQQQTNNRAEMYAVARILESDPSPELPLTICTDSQYAISVFSTWIPGWRARGWRTSTGSDVLNKDLILYVLALIAQRMPPGSKSPTANVSFQKVKAHDGIEGNEQADRLAKNGARLVQEPERDYAAEVKLLEKGLREKGVKEIPRLEFAVYDFDPSDLLSEEELRAMEESQIFD